MVPMGDRNAGGLGSSDGKITWALSIGKATHATRCQRLQPGSATFGLLAPGQSGTLVQRAQSRLRVSLTGTMDAETVATVRTIQRERGLQVDGTIGRQTACTIGLRSTGLPQLGRSIRRARRPRGTTLPERASVTVLQVARHYLDIPYVWGGASRAGMDCSGFTLVVYRETFGISLPHSADSQPSYGRQVSRPSPGDLVHWSGHVAIYYGSGMAIGARHSGTVSQVYPIYGTPTFYRMG
jgi:cell wall-associated NlpC family hydrolase